MPECYIVWDTYKRKLWVSNRGRATWAFPRNAVLSWEASEGKQFNKPGGRYQIHSASIVRGMLVDSEELKG